MFWICLFALNQHDTAEEVGENPVQGPFNAALAHAEGGAVMVLDEEINPFKSTPAPVKHVLLDFCTLVLARALTGCMAVVCCELEPQARRNMVPF